MHQRALVQWGVRVAAGLGLLIIDNSGGKCRLRATQNHICIVYIMLYIFY